MTFLDIILRGTDAVLTVKDKATTPVTTTVGACDGWSFGGYMATQ